MHLPAPCEGSNDRPLARRGCALLGLLLCFNLVAWGWALLAFRHHPALLGIALLAWGFGLRHAVDADHIAAIDNITRKLMQEGKRPLTVGLMFSLGHSTLVVIFTELVAISALRLQHRFDLLRELGTLVGTAVSCLFLLIVAIINGLAFLAIWRRLRGGHAEAESGAGGLLARLFQPLFRLVRKSWHMYLIGVLFGLGFDSASEIGLLGIAAGEASHGLSAWSILVFPVLFTAGMTLLDTADGLLMLGAYGWAFIKPARKLWYNLGITFVSAFVALLIAGIEGVGLLGNVLGGQGAFWRLLDLINDNFETLGIGLVVLFALAWVVSAGLVRLRELTPSAADAPSQD